MSDAAKLQQSLGAELASRLGPEYRYFKSKLQLRAVVSDGEHVLALSGSNKYSPHIEVSFYFGKSFAEARQIERELGIYSFPYHIQQYSPNFAHRGRGDYHGPCTWSFNLHDPPKSLCEELVAAVHGLALPWFKQFGDMRTARDAIANNNRDVFGGPMFWAQVLRLDLALGETQHFIDWSEQLDPLSQSQAKEILSRFQAGRG